MLFKYNIILLNNLDGVGTPLAKITIVDIWEAIETFLTINELNSLDNVDDMKLYLEACLALEYTK